MFLLRDVRRKDLPELKKLASELNTVNLPDNQEMLAAQIEQSVKSFAGLIPDPSIDSTCSSLRKWAARRWSAPA